MICERNCSQVANVKYEQTEFCVAGECRNPADCCCVAKGIEGVNFMCWRARQFDLSAVKQRKDLIDLQHEVQRLQERGTNDEFVTRVEVVSYGCY